MKKIEELKTTHCRYFLHGTCRFADKCWVMHQEEEKELVRTEKKVKELFKKSKRAYPMDPPKEVPKKKAKEEDVKEEREASPTSSSGSLRLVETEEVKGLQDWRSRQPEDMFHNAPWRQGQGKDKGYGGKRDERELLSFSSTGSEPDIQFKGFANMSLSILTRVRQFPQFSEKNFERYVSGEPHTKYKTASGELLEDHGQVKLYGTDQDYVDKSMTARVTDVHRILASGNEVRNRNLIVLDSNGGRIIPGNSKASKRIQAYVEKVLAEEDCKPTKVRVFKGCI